MSLFPTSVFPDYYWENSGAGGITGCGFLQFMVEDGDFRLEAGITALRKSPSLAA